VEAYNLKAAIALRLGDGGGAEQALADMPPRREAELDPVTLHNSALASLGSLDWGGGGALLAAGAAPAAADPSAAFSIALPASVPCPFKTTPSISLDGQPLTGPAPGTGWSAHFRKTDGRWTLAPSASTQGLAKVHGLTGPIDDAFMDGFLFVKPTGKPLNPTVGSWVDSEIKRALPQWRTVFRGDAPTKDDSAITDEDIASKNLVLWGDPTSNRVLARLLATGKLPLTWDGKSLTFRGQTYDAAHHAPILIFPNPLNPAHYVVLNSGIDFREHAYGSNSLQLPKLPDYAIIDLREAPGPRWPGKITTAGFFDESWK
jgi:hypothetical protein